MDGFDSPRDYVVPLRAARLPQAFRDCFRVRTARDGQRSVFEIPFTMLEDGRFVWDRGRVRDGAR